MSDRVQDGQGRGLRKKTLEAERGLSKWSVSGIRVRVSRGPDVGNSPVAGQSGGHAEQCSLIKVWALA